MTVLHHCFAVALLLALLGLAPQGLAQLPGTGTLVCEVTENGAAAAASFRVLSRDRVIAAGRCGPDITLPAGQYELRVVLDGALDAPERRAAVTITAGRTQRSKIAYETGELLVEIFREGRRTIGRVELSRGGRVIAQIGAFVPTRISTGTYSVDVHSRGQTRSFDAVTISRGERRVLAPDFSAR